MERTTLVRLFSPQLLYVNGRETNFELQKLRQSDISVNLSGRSRLEVETYMHNFDTLNVTAHDSAQVIFEMSPDIKGSQMMSFKQVTADLTGYTLLDIGRATTGKLDLNIADTSGIVISGNTIKGMRK